MADSEQGEPFVYTVRFRFFGGRTSERKVCTHFGSFKAVYIAARLGSDQALEVWVLKEGPPPLDADGVPILSGLAIDRNEW